MRLTGLDEQVEFHGKTFRVVSLDMLTDKTWPCSKYPIAELNNDPPSVTVIGRAEVVDIKRGDDGRPQIKYK